LIRQVSVLCSTKLLVHTVQVNLILKYGLVKLCSTKVTSDIIKLQVNTNSKEVTREFVVEIKRTIFVKLHIRM
jgi:hypothetical protein